MAKFSKKQRDFLKSVEAGKPANYSFKNDPYGTPEQRKAKACRKTKIVIGLIGLAGMTAYVIWIISKL